MADVNREVEVARRVAYQKSLPAKRMGAGAVIRDSEGRVLLVNPVYKAGWEFPSLSQDDEASIVLQESELSEWRYCDLAESLILLKGRRGPRLAAVFDGDRIATGLYLEDQGRLR